MKPLSPKDIKPTLPDWVIEGVNNAIKDKYRGNQFDISQNDLIRYILVVAPEGMTKDKIFNNHYLDIEQIYSREGWDVQYDKPGHNETYDAFFTFKPRRND